MVPAGSRLLRRARPAWGLLRITVQVIETDSTGLTLKEAHGPASVPSLKLPGCAVPSLQAGPRWPGWRGSPVAPHRDALSTGSGSTVATLQGRAAALPQDLVGQAVGVISRALAGAPRPRRIAPRAPQKAKLECSRCNRLFSGCGADPIRRRGTPRAGFIQQRVL